MQIIDVNGNRRECVSIAPDKDFPGYLKVMYKNDRRSHFEWYSIEEFKTKNPKLASIFAKTTTTVIEDLGRVSKSSKITLTDKTKVWKENIFTGIPIWISRGKGEGQVRMVKLNNKNTITVDAEWEKLPDKTSQYLVSPNIHSTGTFGNTLPKLTTKKRKTRMN